MDGLALVADPSDARRWRLVGPDPALVSAMNAYLGYLVDRNYSPRTVRTYGYGLLAFARWLTATGLSVDRVGTGDVLDFLARESQGRNPGAGRVRMALVAEAAECLEAARRIALFTKTFPT